MIPVAIGANLPDALGRNALGTCRWAAAALGGLPGLELRRLSRWYASRPVPDLDQPDYVNGVALLAGDISPEDLLARLHGIEAAAGRVRSVPNAARTLDLDLIAHGDLVRPGPAAPVLPHPRMHLRAFVLAPLRDVAPGWRHPVLGVTVEDLLIGTAGQVLRVLGS